MPSSILALGQTAANSSDVTVSNASLLAAAQPAHFGLFPAPAASIPDLVPIAQLSRKDSAGGYQPTGLILTRRTPNLHITAAGVYRVERFDISTYGVNVGVYVD